RTLGPKAPFMAPMLSSLVLAPLLWIKLGRVQGRAETAVPEDDPASADYDDRRCEPTDGE
ncbi:MAG TPA: hypothetical protein DCL63_12390, partial [Firmicutes bacterium]|nr:hypothetical protein [Bacillota bacterium]